MAASGWIARARSVGQSAPLAVALLLVANLVPLVGVLYFGWDVATILILYWLENGVVGALNVVKIMLAAGPPSPGIKGFGNGNGVIAMFFLVHYGLFWLVHGVFVLLFTGRALMPGLADPVLAVAAEPPLLFAAAALLISHATSLWLNYIGRGEYRSASAGSQMWQPYPRMFVLHITIVFGGILILNQRAPVLFIALLVMLKTAMDLILHLREHNRFQRVAAAPPIV